MPTFPNLLRREQVEANKTEVSRLESALQQPNIQDPGLIVRQIRALKSTLDTYTPTAFKSNEVDAIVRRQKQLEAEMLEGMPSKLQMRRNPPGTVHQLQTWEKLNKPKLAEWKHNQLRLNPDSTDPDVANFERFRPAGSVNAQPMDGAWIPGKVIVGANTVVPGSVATDKELEVLGEVDAEIRARFSTLTGEQRVEILEKVRDLIDAREAAAPAKAPRTKRELTPEQRKAIGDRLAKARAAKKDKVSTPGIQTVDVPQDLPETVAAE